MQVAAIIVNNSSVFETDGICNDLQNNVNIAEIRFLHFSANTMSLLKSYEGAVRALIVYADEQVLPTLSESLAREMDDFLQSDETGTGVFTLGAFDIFLSPIEEEQRQHYYMNVCLPRLKRLGLIKQSLVFRGVGCAKSKWDACIKKCVSFSNEELEFSYTNTFDDARMEVIYNETTPKVVLDNVTRVIAEQFKEELYALDDTPIEKRLYELLKLRGRKISVAESFTAGGLAKKIVSVAGASEVYFEGLNTYDSTSKIKRLNVSSYTLNTVGAVSDQTAYEMCAGLLSTGDCSVAVATTGLAGPKSDSSDLPVGLCFLAVGIDDKIYIARHMFSGTRKTITEKAINHALFWVYEHLK